MVEAKHTAIFLCEYQTVCLFHGTAFQWLSVTAPPIPGNRMDCWRNDTICWRTKRSANSAPGVHTNGTDLMTSTQLVFRNLLNEVTISSQNVIYCDYGMLFHIRGIMCQKQGKGKEQGQVSCNKYQGQGQVITSYNAFNRCSILRMI